MTRTARRLAVARTTRAEAATASEAEVMASEVEAMAEGGVAAEAAASSTMVGARGEGMAQARVTTRREAGTTATRQSESKCVLLVV